MRQKAKYEEHSVGIELTSNGLQAKLGNNYTLRGAL